LKIEPKHRRRKLPWYDHLFGVVGVVMFASIQDWLRDLGLSPLVMVFGTLVGSFAAGYLAVGVGKRLSGRFPAFETEHVGRFDR
jgi:hypothetical protein